MMLTEKGCDDSWTNLIIIFFRYFHLVHISILMLK